LVLLDEVLRRIAGFLVKEDRLELIRERTLKAYRNQRFQQPYQVREGPLSSSRTR
jgi:secreted Zn-dependent insulinase-like peptidase